MPACFTCFQYHLHAVQENHSGIRLGITFYFLINSFQLEGSYPFSSLKTPTGSKSNGGQMWQVLLSNWLGASQRSLGIRGAQWHGWWLCQQSTMNRHTNNPREISLGFSSYNHYFFVFTKPSNIATLASPNNDLCSRHLPHVHIHLRQGTLFHMLINVQTS